MERKLRRRSPSQVHRGANLIAQGEVPGDEVGVEVRQHHVGDGQSMFTGERHILADITLRVDHHGTLR